ncbi:hypothetical protein ACH5RR_002782 [Cinchona calisaya]|uniref:Non-specific serine/threonine protein kinase n=1 Tax=Cinchona calisaya TaxID=153742 RepID=A0ABD3ATB6_9GENT
MLSFIEVQFSNNQLTGPIPTLVPFHKSPNSSVFGNNSLCSELLSASCRNLNGSGYVNYHHRVSYRIILAVIGSDLDCFCICDHCYIAIYDEGEARGICMRWWNY